ncbi:DUF2625 family protein [Actinophytocola sp. NPDC049390]|uniref:DUF2625 family protein n=1 Tax=Actinophytocola sp. NPDC049390 TaxID=3363894 RepID=UPI00379663EF
MRDLTELINVADPAWPELRAELGREPVRMFPGDPVQGQDCLRLLQVTAASALGALTLYTGGLTVDNGWVRVFGGAAAPDGPPNLAHVNRMHDPSWQREAGLVVGQDVLGGVFVLNGVNPSGYGRPGAPGQMVYFAPDTLEWEALDLGHSAWLSWLAAGGTTSFYKSLRWPGWEAETRALGSSHGIAVYPFLWSEQAHADLAATERGPAPMAEILALNIEMCGQLGLPDPGFLGATS